MVRDEAGDDRLVEGVRVDLDLVCKRRRATAVVVAGGFAGIDETGARGSTGERPAADGLCLWCDFCIHHGRARDN